MLCLFCLINLSKLFLLSKNWRRAFIREGAFVRDFTVFSLLVDTIKVLSFLVGAQVK